MFLTKGVIYLVLLGLAAIASLMFFGFALVKEKAKRRIPRGWDIALGVLLLAVTITGGTVLTIKAYSKIKKSVIALKNFPQTVESDQSRDTTDYVRTLKELEPAKYKGKVPEQYYTEYGFYDWWRFPVVYPYAIYCIDVLDKGGIANDSGKTNFDNGGSINIISPHFNSFMFDRNFFIGQSMIEPGKDETSNDYFILYFQTGKIESVKNKEELFKKLDSIGFQGTREFISTRTYSTKF